MSQKTPPPHTTRAPSAPPSPTGYHPQPGGSYITLPNGTTVPNPAPATQADEPAQAATATATATTE